MIAIGADHGGYKLKEEIKKYLEEKEIKYIDLGTDSLDRTDYPIYAKKVAELVSKKACEAGILLCRSGFGMTVVANKFKGVRSAPILTEEQAIKAKADDDINLITLAGDNLNVSTAVSIIRAWLGTEFKKGRYQERIEMIDEIEKENFKKI